MPLYTPASASAGPRVVRLTSDQAVASPSITSTVLALSVEAGAAYRVEAALHFVASAGGVHAKFNIDLPAAATLYATRMGLNSSSIFGLDYHDDAFFSNISAGTSNTSCWIEGLLASPTNAGSLTIQAGPVNAGTLTLLTGSSLTLTKV